ncbi:MAG: hypothetical protein CK431_10025 [Mycobacterium sp.]|nr:MAG: hypothetical protein CK431_10025 [Mycobacterium sp.]
MCSICAALAAALLLGEPHGSLAFASRELQRDDWPYIRHALSRKNISTGIQAVGALITFYGLGRAYTRARNNQKPGQWLYAQAKRAWNKLLRRTRRPMHHVGSATLAISAEGSASFAALHKVDITQSLHQQIKRLAAFVNKRSLELTETEIKVAGIERELRQMQAEAVELERRTWTHIQSQIQDLNQRLDRVQVLDLTWAIWGLFISFTGTLWSFGT